MIPSLLNTISVGAISLLVALLYGTVLAGLFALALRMLALPAALVGQAVRTVFYPKTAEVERNGGSLIQLTETATSVLVFASVPVFGSVLLFGPEMFALAFGAEWRQAGVVSAILAPWLATSFISSPLSGLMTVKDQLGQLFYLSLLETTLRLSSLAAGYLMGEPMVGIACYSAAGTIISLYYIGWSLRLSGSSGITWTRTRWRYLAVAAATYGTLLACRSSISYPLFALLAGSLTITMLAFALIRVKGIASLPHPQSRSHVSVG
jgi:O-antigen/teichoic acid export membrane protein